MMQEWCDKHFDDLMDLWCGGGIAETTKCIEPLDAPPRFMN
jgi:hypothetical protein